MHTPQHSEEEYVASSFRTASPSSAPQSSSFGKQNWESELRGLRSIKVSEKWAGAQFWQCVAGSEGTGKRDDPQLLACSQKLREFGGVTRGV